MAKINLLTIHYGKCYGAVMQTYATCRLLEEAGHQVTVINLIHPRCRKTYFNIKNLSDLYREFQFWRFKKKYFSKLTNKSYTIDGIRLPKADYYIVGSDQVWNKDITKVFKDVFYLPFVQNTKKIAFCSSFGKSEWEGSKDETIKIKKMLESFDAISVREITGEYILKNIFSLDSVRLMDPTLEYGNFDSFIKNKSPKKEIFTFLLMPKDEMVEYISERLNLPVHKRSFFSDIYARGPLNWLENIYRSELVITDSFHGLALSILLKKQFLVLCADEKKFTRLYSLLKLLHLESKYVKSKEDFDIRRKIIMASIDYKEIDKILSQERNICKMFIEKNLQ